LFKTSSFNLLAAASCKSSETIGGQHEHQLQDEVQVVTLTTI